MKILSWKPFWSAIAVSLCLWASTTYAQIEAVDDLVGLESEVLPDLEGVQRFSPPKLHEEDEWNVDDKKVIQDVEPLKGQNYSVLPWKTEGTEEFLDVEKWIRERAIRDKVPDWKIRLRVEEHKELMGKVLACKGTCEIYRGSQKSKVEHLSRVYEEDEFHVGEDSVAWVYLLDGSLVRISSSSFVNFQEINFTQDQAFILLRLGEGHMFWSPRTDEGLDRNDLPETDPQALPLLVREANQAFYERRIYQNQKPEERLLEMFSIYDRAQNQVFDEINMRKIKNKSMIKSRLMMIMPNLTTVSEGSAVDFVHVVGGKSYLKKRSHTDSSTFKAYFRGYSSEEVQDVADTDWREVDVHGRTMISTLSAPGVVQVLELLTKRVKTYELAREIWFEKFSLPLIAALKNPEKLGREFGYSIWADEWKKREAFVLEDTRRRETTNLRATQNLIEKMATRGEPRSTELDMKLYQTSVNSYLMSLKTRFDMRHLERRHMSDLQYYVWILKNVKK